MKINWKEVCKSPGYKSLKAAYISDVQDAAKTISKGRKPMRNKQEFLQHFKWVIGRAEHYALHWGCALEAILDKWERNRTYWWLNYYQEGRQPKFHKHNRYRQSLRGMRNYYKKSRMYNKATRKRLMCREIKSRQDKASTKSPARWSNGTNKFV